MSQLIKLDNYISRYERNIFHYPSQFSRLKTENWNRLKQLWQDQLLYNVSAEANQEEPQDSYFSKWRSFFNSRSEIENQSDEVEILPKTEEALKQYFLDALFPFQLKWASTTIDRMSFIDKTYNQDFLLKYFLQRIPDTHLLLYMPVFQLKNGPIEGEIILISPLEIEIITLIEKSSTQHIIPNDTRTWYVDEFNVQSKVLSPMIAVKRTETIVHSILKKYGLDYPVKKVILSRTNTIDSQTEPYRTKYVDANQHENWLKQKQTLYTPLKHQQLKVADALLKHCESVAVRRPEWQQEESTQIL
ncbi:NERD domain-containing protein [Gracilibacillus caseinilyticus]|uniref:NERD domain-containing protein n=1 Tax=Gracilibacillus caseinilyticus TaxID=2932256 RepID=A0ABY4ETZ2_9BACI|nr:NERD domain-containing protein [Gracilibacillus caseinilyticus]UOQ47099.1 NERD domain-containing protein [Gracilibacillus caseinilyticus]